MCRAVGYVLAVIAALLAVLAAWLILAAGGREPEPIMVTGGFMLALAGVIGALAALVLRAK